jgi:hypothetical protein
MRVLKAVNGLLRGFASRMAMARARREFSCGDCDRWERCGLSPTDTCIIRAAQLGRRDRRVPYLYLMHW